MEPTLEAERPSAYLIPKESSAGAEVLRLHGVKVEELREEMELEVQAYQVTAVDQVARPFQKHQSVTVEVKPRTVKQKLPAGTLIVKTAQPLGILAAYLLEPQAEDGLTTWNFFDKGLLPGKDFPVVRQMKAAR